MSFREFITKTDGPEAAFLTRISFISNRVNSLVSLNKKMMMLIQQEINTNKVYSTAVKARFTQRASARPDPQSSFRTSWIKFKTNQKKKQHKRVAQFSTVRRKFTTSEWPFRLASSTGELF